MTETETKQTETSIRGWITDKLGEWLGLEPAGIDPSKAFIDYGIGSIAAVSMAGELEDWLDFELDPTLLFEYPNIDALTAYLVAEVATRK